MSNQISEDCSYGLHDYCTPCECRCHRKEERMKIQQTYEIDRIRFEMTLETLNLETHSKLTDLNKHKLTSIKERMLGIMIDLAQVLQEIPTK